MLKKHTLTILILTLAFLFSVGPRVRIAQTSETAIVYIDPPEVTNLTIGDTFTVNVTVANVTDLAGYTISLYYNPKVVNASSYEEGPFLRNVRGTSFWVFDWNDNYNATHGHIELVCFLLDTGPGADGSGTLATLTFKIKSLGYSPLSFDEDETLLRDSTPHDPQPIPHTTKDGLVDTRIHNIAVTEVTPSKTTVAKGDFIFIYVTVQNAGNFTENFNLTAYCNTTAIATQTLTLTDGASTTKTFTWNTTGFAIGNYTIKAIADQVPGETETGDNTKENGVVNIVLPKIKITDLIIHKTIVCQGCTIQINVTTLNEADSPQTFNLTTYYNTTEIETKTITQNGNSNLTTPFTWNTTDLTEYTNYTISAHADYDTLIDGTILIVHIGDVSPVDMKVRVDDILAIALAFGTTYPEPEYDAILDINCDLKIRVDDLLAAVLEFGWTKP